MDYEISFDSKAEGLLRCDSPETEKFIGPAIAPTSLRLLRILSDMVGRSDGTIFIDSERLAGRLGVGARTVDESMQRLCQRKIAKMSSGESGSTRVVVDEWINPPRAAVRAKLYPEALIAEFNDFVSQVESFLERDRVDVEPPAGSRV